jgi:hypothetical protein
VTGPVEQPVVHENDTPPDTSQGYTHGTPRVCPSSYTLIVQTEHAGPQQAVYRCQLDRRHGGDHRQGGVHWQSQGVGFTVDQEEGATE